MDDPVAQLELQAEAIIKEHIKVELNRYFAGVYSVILDARAGGLTSVPSCGTRDRSP